MAEQEFPVVTEEESEPRQSWHPPQLERADINFDTAGKPGSGNDGLSVTAPS